MNLCLAVSPPEPAGGARSGWHRIASWFHAVDLWDEIEIERLAVGAGGCDRSWASDAPRPSPIDWPESSDLAVRAHRSMEELAGRPLPAHVRVTKRIPTGGGLGGGSSDAASVMMALNRLFGLDLGVGELRRASARLGSDVAFFITDRDPTSPPPPALVTGFGDAIVPALALDMPITLIVPEFGCPTPAVYRAFDGLGPVVFREADAARLCGGAVFEPRGLDSALFNDLLPAAERVEPRLAAARAELVARGHVAHLSGSGSTLFVLGDAPVAARAGCVVVRTRLVGGPGAPGGY